MWSKHNPNLQLLWDATSFRALMTCPRKYQLGIIEGWRSKYESEHLTFGILFQKAVEIFQLRRLAGDDDEAAMVEGLRYLVQASGDFIPYTTDGATLDYFQWHPWGGAYQEMWRCSGTEPYKNEKGNRAKCPFSHKGKWFLVEGSDAVWQSHDNPEDCGDYCNTCDSLIELQSRWVPEHPSKNRETLLRTFVAFADTEAKDFLKPFAFPDGTPAIELNVVVPMGRRTLAPANRLCQFDLGEEFVREGEDYQLVANLDEINEWRGALYPTDNKTTKNTLGANFFAGFSPDIQFDLYDLIASLFLHDYKVGGVAVRGVQVTATGNNIETAVIDKTEAEREELFKELHWWLDQAEGMAESGYYPMNRANCRMCNFRGVCASDPEGREAQLNTHFERKPWHPVERNG